MRRQYEIVGQLDILSYASSVHLSSASYRKKNTRSRREPSGEQLFPWTHTKRLGL